MNKRITIIEVGPRDGFQNVSEFIPTETKLEIIAALARAGVSALEVTSFVNPKAMPQMADAKQVAVEARTLCGGARLIALVPNLRGAQNALDAGIGEISYVISASEAHNKANVNRTIAESVEELMRLREALPQIKLRVDVATAFACPYEGVTPPENVMRLIAHAMQVSAAEIVLCDTIGVANPRQVGELAGRVRDAYPELAVSMHLHNTRGMGLANTFAAMQRGITSFETSLGGLGGCPFAPGAAGNTATEDTVNMLHAMGCETGIDEERLLDAARLVREKVPAKLTGFMLNARRYSSF